MSIKVICVLVLGVITNSAHSRLLKKASNTPDEKTSAVIIDTVKTTEVEGLKPNVTYGIYTNTSAEALKPLVDRIDKNHL